VAAWITDDRPRACLLYAEVEDDGGEDDASEVGDGVFVVAAGDAVPLLEAPEAAFDAVAFLVQVGVEVWWPSTEKAFGLAAVDLLGSGIECGMFNARRRRRVEGCQ
jgi:hypothetical protein